MNTATLVRAFAGREPLTWFFHVLTLALGAAIVLSLVLFEQAVADRLQRDLAGINLVVGAKGSPSQLVLSALLQVDAPTGNIPESQVARFAAHPLVKTVIPVSIGDSINGARIVGTVPGYADLFGATLKEGVWWQESMQAVVGAAAAKRLHLAVGDKFRGQHGLSGGESHAIPYVVTGILGATGTTIDDLVLTDQRSVWALHEVHSLAGLREEHEEELAHAKVGEPAANESPGGNAHVGEPAANDSPSGNAHVGEPHARPHEVTALLIRYRSPMGAVILPRLVSETPDLQPAVPALEVARLVKLLGVSSEVLSWIGLVLLALAATGFVVALFTALGQRRRELSLLRAMGASRRLIVTLVAFEGVALGAIGGLIGLLLSRALLWLATFAGRDTPFASLSAPPPGGRELAALALAMGLALLASMPAAWRASRFDPALELARG